MRSLRADDLAELARYRSDPEVARYQSWDAFTIEEARELLADLTAQAFGTTGTWHQLAIARDDRLIGDVGLHFVDEHQLELGFTLAREHHGQGLAREAIGALVDWCFAQGRHRIYAITDARNATAARLLEVLRFRREGHYRENILFKGAWGDEYFYARLRRE